MKISVVIPVYQAEGCLTELHRQLVSALTQLTPDYEIILVEDCGNDNSWKVIQELAKADPQVRGFKLSRNFGQHHAITAGLDKASGDWTIIMDCDLQDKPKDIHRLLDEALKGNDIVIARWNVRKDVWWKRLTASIFYKVFSMLAGYQYDNGIRSFRIMSRAATVALCSMKEQMRSLAPLSTWLGFDTAYVTVEHSDRLAGNSSYSWRRLMNLATNNIVAFSDKPLKISIGIGFLISMLAFAFGGYTILRVLLYGIPVPGWTSVITSLYFLSGLILMNLGVIGIYLGKAFDETKGRPLYIISKSTEPTAL
jgi:glycosyltransferase involved in cell wall biosynthesis